jgi:hypothetical protein
MKTNPRLPKTPRLSYASLFFTLALLGACTQLTQAVTEETKPLETGASALALTIPSTPQSWDYRIAQVINSSAQQVVNQDVWDASAQSISSLHAAGKKVICYFSAGTWEYTNNGRGIINQALTDRNGNGVIDGNGDTAEAAAVSAAIQAGSSSYNFGGQTRAFGGDQTTFKQLAGTQLPGWDEYVYKIGNFTPSSSSATHRLLRAIIQGHVSRATAIGCDALEPDNIDAYANVTQGISAGDQYQYNLWLTVASHAQGLPIYLKNDLDQIDDGAGVPAGNGRGLAYSFDGLINEECFKFKECEAAETFRDLGKPIFVREYAIAATCTNYRNARYRSGSAVTRQQIANQYHLPTPTPRNAPSAVGERTLGAA